MARAGIEGLVARLPLRVALALRSRRPMRGLLRRRRAAISATVAGAVLGAAAIATIDRPTLPDRRFADSGRMLGSLRETGRLLGAELDADGRVVSLQLLLPELGALGLEGSVATDAIVFDATGAVLFLNAKSAESLSQ